MVCNNNRDTGNLMQLTAHFANRCIRIEQVLRCDASDRKNQFRPDQCNLAFQKRPAQVCFIRFRITVPGRTAFQDIGNVNLFALKPDRCQHRIQQLPGTPHKWFTLAIFIRAWSLADYHPVGIACADAKHRLRATSTQTAGGTVPYCFDKHIPIHLRNACSSFTHICSGHRT